MVWKRGKEEKKRRRLETRGYRLYGLEDRGARG